MLSNSHHVPRNRYLPHFALSQWLFLRMMEDDGQFPRARREDALCHLTVASCGNKFSGNMRARMSALAKGPGFSRAHYHAVRCTYCLRLVNAYTDVFRSITVRRLCRNDLPWRWLVLACLKGKGFVLKHNNSLLRKFPLSPPRILYLFSLRRLTYSVLLLHGQAAIQCNRIERNCPSVRTVPCR